MMKRMVKRRVRVKMETRKVMMKRVMIKMRMKTVFKLMTVAMKMMDDNNDGG